MKNTMKSSKMAKKANALKGFLNSMGKKKGEMGMSNPNAFLTKPKKPTNTMPSNKPSFSPNVAPSAGKVYNAPPKTTREMYDYAAKKSASIPTRTMKKGGLKSVDAEKNPGLAKLPTDVRNKMGYMKKGGMSKMANEAFNNAKRTITDGYRGTGAPNPLAAIVKNTGNKSKMGKKPKMQMGGPFFSMNPSTPMIATEGENFEKKESFKKGGMTKKKKK